MKHGRYCGVCGNFGDECNCPINPATGEWTEIVDRADKELEETVANFLAGLGYESGKVKEIIRQAINAALAAERERYEKRVQMDSLALASERAEHQQQLAAAVTGLHRLYALRDVNCQEQAKRAYDAALEKIGGKK